MSLLKKKDAAQEPEVDYQELRRQKKAADRAAEKEAEKAYEAGLKKPKREPTLKGKELRAEIKRIHTERKALRKQLRKEGVKEYSDFYMLASEVGLGYPDDAALEQKATKFWANASGALNLALNLATILRIMVFGILALLVVFFVSYLSEAKGRFTVNLTADMLQDGFTLSESADFDQSDTRLYAGEITNVNATSIYEISRTVDKKDGDNNGAGYMAYTFYLKNAGQTTANFGYTVNILSDSLGTGKATWIMFFENGKQIVYAWPQDDTGKAENLFGYPDAPFAESAYDAEAQYYEEDGKWGIVTTPYIDEETALQGYVEDFGPGEMRKYTVVVWLEGDDPDCNNSILGGHIGYNVQFERLDNEATGYFKGLFRQEYEKSYYVEEIPETDYGDAGTGVRNPEEAETP